MEGDSSPSNGVGYGQSCLLGPELGSTTGIVSDGPTDRKQMLCRGEKIIGAQKMEPY